MRVFVLLVFTTVCFIPTPIEGKPSKSCKYWCKEEYSYLCCPNGKKIHKIFAWTMEAMEELFDLQDYPWLIPNSWVDYLLPVIFKRSSLSQWPAVDEQSHSSGCSTVRPSCPRSYEWLQQPTSCDHDDECSDTEKCCYDICLEHKTCKPSVTTDR